jgi:hypothetical protein
MSTCDFEDWSIFRKCIAVCFKGDRDEAAALEARFEPAALEARFELLTLELCAVASDIIFEVSEKNGTSFFFFVFELKFLGLYFYAWI